MSGATAPRPGEGDHKRIPKFGVDRFALTLREFQVGVSKAGRVRIWNGPSRPSPEGFGTDAYGPEKAPKGLWKGRKK